MPDAVQSPGASASSATPKTAGRPCPSCGVVAAGGRFCAECGASLTDGVCGICRSQLEPGAKFCHRCGSAVGALGAPGAGAQGPRSLGTLVPWGVAALAIIALIAFAAGRNLLSGLGRSDSAPEATGEVAANPADASQSAAAADAPVPRAPDISAMSPRERADRLYDRVMRLNDEGKRDSVDFFAQMVISAYQMLGPLDLDQHYDVGRIGEVTGATSLARAEADTILRADPTHLLGLTLAAHTAKNSNQGEQAKAFYRRLVAAAPAEKAKGLPEYERHRNDIEAALSEAKRMGISG